MLYPCRATVKGDFLFIQSSAMRTSAFMSEFGSTGSAYIQVSAGKKEPVNTNCCIKQTAENSQYTPNTGKESIQENTERAQAQQIVHNDLESSLIQQIIHSRYREKENQPNTPDKSSQQPKMSERIDGRMEIVAFPYIRIVCLQYII